VQPATQTVLETLEGFDGERLFSRCFPPSSRARIALAFPGGDKVIVARARARCAAGAVLAGIAVLAIASRTAAAPPSAVPPALLATFTTKIDKAAYPVLLPGRYTISFGVNGTLRSSAPDQPSHVTAVVKVTGDRIDFSRSLQCPTMSGSYRWAITERILTFAKITDRCRGRSLTLANRNWIKLTYRS
jgi:hypothetical protein